MQLNLPQNNISIPFIYQATRSLIQEQFYGTCLHSSLHVR